MLLNVIIFSLVLLCSCTRGMEQPPDSVQSTKAAVLPGDMIRLITACIPGASNWTDTNQAFGLQSLALLNRHWNQSIRGLFERSQTDRDFPYLFPL